jgi:hypothetical protein
MGCGIRRCVSVRETMNQGLVVASLRYKNPFMDTTANNERLKREWTDQYVTVNAERPELKRFAGLVGRVVTVNFNNKAVVDFADGGWYDISASDEFLKKVDPAEGKTKYDPKVNSAQPYPEKQG